MRKMSELIEATCDNCGKVFHATFEQLDHTGFFTIYREKNKEVIRIFNFCSYSCEKEFVPKLRKSHPDIHDKWTEATEEDKQRFPEYYEK